MYLLQFLYAHQDEKILVFTSNCESVNLIHKILKELDWNKLESKKIKPKASETNQTIFGGSVYKLHGNMEHTDRK